MPPISRLLVRLPNPVGDVVMATPLLQSLREQLPEAWVGLAGRPGYQGLLDGLTCYDEYLALKQAGVRAQAKQLKSAKADAILLLPNSWSSALAARLAGIPLRVGRRSLGRSMLLKPALEPVGPARPMTEIYLDMLPALGLENPAVPPPATLIARSASQADAESAQRFIGLAPGAAFGPSKVYPLDQLVVACHTIYERHSLPFLLLGSPSEAALLSQIAAGLRTVGVDAQLPAPGDLADAKRQIARCKVLLTMDSGARHMAVALGVPQVVIYGPTHPGWSAHGLETSTILRRDELDCIACHKKHCPIDHRCMTRIPPQQVADAVFGALDPRAGAV